MGFNSPLGPVFPQASDKYFQHWSHDRNLAGKCARRSAFETSCHHAALNTPNTLFVAGQIDRQAIYRNRLRRESRRTGPQSNVVCSTAARRKSALMRASILRHEKV